VTTSQPPVPGPDAPVPPVPGPGARSGARRRRPRARRRSSGPGARSGARGRGPRARLPAGPGPPAGPARARVPAAGLRARPGLPAGPARARVRAPGLRPSGLPAGVPARRARRPVAGRGRPGDLVDGPAGHGQGRRRRGDRRRDRRHHAGRRRPLGGRLRRARQRPPRRLRAHAAHGADGLRDGLLLPALGRRLRDRAAPAGRVRAAVPRRPRRRGRGHVPGPRPCCRVPGGGRARRHPVRRERSVLRARDGPVAPAGHVLDDPARHRGRLHGLLRRDQRLHRPGPRGAVRALDRAAPRARQHRLVRRRVGGLLARRRRRHVAHVRCARGLL